MVQLYVFLLLAVLSAKTFASHEPDFEDESLALPLPSNIYDQLDPSSFEADQIFLPDEVQSSDGMHQDMVMSKPAGRSQTVRDKYLKLARPMAKKYSKKQPLRLNTGARHVAGNQNEHLLNSPAIKKSAVTGPVVSKPLDEVHSVSSKSVSVSNNNASLSNRTVDTTIASIAENPNATARVPHFVYPTSEPEDEQNKDVGIHLESNSVVFNVDRGTWESFLQVLKDAEAYRNASGAFPQPYRMEGNFSVVPLL